MDDFSIGEFGRRKFVYLRDSGMGRREGGVTENGAALSGGKQSKL